MSVKHEGRFAAGGLRRRWQTLAAVFCLLFAITLPARAGALALDWTLRSSQTTALDLTQLVYGNGQFVAAASDGVYVSADGTAWKRADKAAASGLVVPAMITFAEGAFYALDWEGAMYQSKDGLAWAKADTGRNDVISKNENRLMAYGDHRLVLVGRLTEVLQFPFSPKTGGYSPMLGDEVSVIGYGPNGFAALDGGTWYLSKDGLDWAYGNLPAALYSNAIAYGSGRYVAVGDGGQIMTADDGKTWKLAESPTGNRLRGLTYGGGRFVAVGDRGTVLTSPDGLKWTRTAGDGAYSLIAVAYGGSGYVAVGENGTVLTSKDGATWTDRSGRVIDRILSDVTYTGSQFVAVGDQGAILTSPDGGTWAGRTSGTANWLTGVISGGKTIVAVGDRGTILTSGDGLAWTARTSGVTVRLADVAYGPKGFVAVGARGTILTSTDGVAWKKASSGTTVNLVAAAYGNGQYYAAGERGAVLYSSDGLTWKDPGDLGFADTITGVAASGQVVVLATEDQTRVIDGQGLWRFPDLVDGQGVIYTGSQFVLWTETDLYLGADGHKWSSAWTRTTGIRAVAFGGGRYVAVGTDGLIVTGTEPAPDPVCKPGLVDVPADHPYCRAINQMVSDKVISTLPDGTFHPKDTVTRAQFAAFALNALGISWDATRPWPESVTTVAATKGIIPATWGRESAMISLTRADLLEGLTRLAKLTVAATWTSPYSDLAAGTLLAKQAAAATKAGLIGSGAPQPVFTGAEFLSDQEVTRGELAAVLYNFKYPKK